MPDTEKRTIVGRFELRSDGDDAPPVIEGYASVFDTPYQVGPFTERVARSAFNRTLNTGPDVRLLIDHEGQPLARTKSGTLQLSVDDTGLRVRAQLDPSDPDVQRLLPKLKRGDMDQMSFAFRTVGDEWDFSNPERALRTLTEVSLADGDVSCVTYPASPTTSVGVRSLHEARCLLVENATRELRSGDGDNDSLRVLLRRTLAQMDAEVRMTANDTWSSLQEAVADAYSEQGWAYVEDWDDSFVYYSLYTRDDNDTFRQPYTLADDGMASLSGEPEQVRARTTWQPVTDPDGQQAPADDGMQMNAAEGLMETVAQTHAALAEGEEKPRRTAEDLRRLLAVRNALRAA